MATGISTVIKFHKWMITYESLEKINGSDMLTIVILDKS